MCFSRLIIEFFDRFDGGLIGMKWDKNCMEIMRIDVRNLSMKIEWGTLIV